MDLWLQQINPCFGGKWGDMQSIIDPGYQDAFEGVDLQFV
jgi:hypothetical protein